MPFPYHQGMWEAFFFSEKCNILCSDELQLSVFLNHNISTLLTFGVKINTFKEAEWQNPAVLAGYLQDIKEGKNAQCIWKYKSWHFSGVLMDSSRWFFGRMLSHLACFTMSVELYSTCQLLKMWFHKSNKMGKSRSRVIFKPTDT